MSGRAVAILVSLLALLVVAVVLTQPERDKSARSVRNRLLVQAPPSQIGAIEVRDGAGGIVRVEPGMGWGGWFVRWGSAEQEQELKAWPASESTRTAAARILSTTQLQPGTKSDLASSTHVSIEKHDGTVLTSMQVGDQALAGLLPVRLVDEREGWFALGKEVGEFLKPEALLMWRQTSVLPGLDANVTGISIGHADRVVLALKRVGKNWSLTYPVAEPADPTAVQTLLEGLIGLRADSFTEAPVVGDIHTLTIDVPGQTDAGDRRYMVIAGEDEPVVDVALSLVKNDEVDPIARTRLAVPDTLAEFLDVDPASFVSKRVLSLPGSEIARISVVDEGSDEHFGEAVRGPSGWEGAFADVADSWVSILTERRADRITLGPLEVPASYRVVLERFGGLDLGTFVLAQDEVNGVLWIGRDGVWRGYDFASGEPDLGVDLGIGLGVESD